MYGLIFTGEFTPEQYQQLRDIARNLAEALSALDDATIMLVPLVAETDWRSDGVQALSEAIRRFAEQCTVQAASLRERERELGALV